MVEFGIRNSEFGIAARPTHEGEIRAGAEIRDVLTLQPLSVGWTVR
jgi:hypothetical protein